MDETQFHHVTGRGVMRRTLFHDERDYARFIKYLAVAIEPFEWQCHSYCLIPNHYHLLIESKIGTLGRGMLVLAGSYARYYNYRYKTDGHVFQGPYVPTAVETDEHLMDAFRYIALNPVKAGLCARPEDWRWSSYRATAGLERYPPWLRVDFARRLFEPHGGYAKFCNPVATELQPGC
jgi:REP-associated tyrosine transposase